MREVAEALIEVLASGRRGALATVVRAHGSTPQRAGARLLLRSDGSRVGTVGGGAIEHVVVEALARTRESGTSQLLAYNLGYDLGMCCGGRMELFIEPIEALPRLFVFGAGHVAKPTASLARSVGFSVTVVDEREELNTGERFPGCNLELDDPPNVLRRAALSDGDWLLIVTHDHQVDEETLELALTKSPGPRYVGLVGSRRKIIRLVQRVAARRGKLSLDRLYAPVGLDLGAVGPEEIAVSIVAELLALRHGRQAPHLRAVDEARLSEMTDEQESESR